MTGCGHCISWEGTHETFSEHIAKAHPPCIYCGQLTFTIQGHDMERCDKAKLMKRLEAIEVELATMKSWLWEIYNKV
jgi:hypothetical protein